MRQRAGSKRMEKKGKVSVVKVKIELIIKCHGDQYLLTLLISVWNCCSEMG
jgi:hypothetical protein